MKCYECIHNAVCSVTHDSNSDACQDFLPIDHFETLEHKLKSLLSYITDGQYSEPSYTIEEMQTFVDDALKVAANDSVTQAEAVIEDYRNDIISLREENTALKDTIVKMVMERMRTK